MSLIHNERVKLATNASLVFRPFFAHSLRSAPVLAKAALGGMILSP